MRRNETNPFRTNSLLPHYRYIQLYTSQENKREQFVSGDLVRQERNERYTLVALFDGIGSGIKARIAAELSCAGLLEMLRLGFSLRTAVGNIIKTMHKARTEDVPFAAFSLAYILPNNNVTIFSYESPLPIFYERKHVYLPKVRYITLHNEVVAECVMQLREHNGFILLSDGITQASIGSSQPARSLSSQRLMGHIPGYKWDSLNWSYPGIIQFIKEHLFERENVELIPQVLLSKATEVSGGGLEDDATALLITSREGRIVHLLTGPPANPALDKQLAEKFMQLPGYKIICGSTTAEIVARQLNKNIKVIDLPGAFHQPPKYELEGVDIVTEGAVVLNQLYNVIDEEIQGYHTQSCVTELALLLKSVDVIHIWLGSSENPEHNSIEFMQLGILPRKRIIDLLVHKWKKMNKLVILRSV